MIFLIDFLFLLFLFHLLDPLSFSIFKNCFSSCCRLLDLLFFATFVIFVISVIFVGAPSLVGLQELLFFLLSLGRFVIFARFVTSVTFAIFVGPPSLVRLQK